MLLSSTDFERTLMPHLLNEYGRTLMLRLASKREAIQMRLSLNEHEQGRTRLLLNLLHSQKAGITFNLRLYTIMLLLGAINKRMECKDLLGTVLQVQPSQAWQTYKKIVHGYQLDQNSRYGQDA